MNLCPLANRLWVGANRFRWRRFASALADPATEQERILRGYVRSNIATEFGREHGFDRIDSVSDYRRCVPLSSHDDYLPLIDRIRRGESAVLTREPVRRLVPSSGSTAACKLIPYTDSLQAEFQRGIGPWIVDLYRSMPALKDGAAYWAISPAIHSPTFGAASFGSVSCDASSVPIGFDEDSSYVGGLSKRLVDSTLAVPAAVREIRDMRSFRYVTLLHLLRAEDLRLISVWHPAFLTLLLEPLATWWDQLLEDIANGTVTPPRALEAPLRGPISRKLKADSSRARHLREVGPEDTQRIWPRLTLISCWGDGHAACAARALGQIFPSVALQKKGLLATEAFVTLPFGDDRPVAVRSHFFEFLDERESVFLLDELRIGAEYSVVVTTAGGFYRYRLRDRVKVERLVGRTPSLRFLGKEDSVSDRFGEKLSEGHATEALRKTLDAQRVDISFAMLAPDEREEGVGYTLYLESRLAPPRGLAGDVHEALSTNPNYRYSVSLGQLAPLRIFRISGRAQHAYLERYQRLGRRLGDIKPTALSRDAGWSGCFEGEYV